MGGALVDEFSKDAHFQVGAVKLDGLADAHPAEVIAVVRVRHHHRGRQARARRRSREVAGEQPQSVNRRIP
jgi:hypothetical protein